MSTYKDLIGKEDLRLWSGTGRTYTRRTSTGGTATLHRVGEAVDVAAIWGTAGEPEAQAIVNALAFVNTSVCAFLLTTGAWTIDRAITIPANVTLVVPPGAMITKAAGGSLVINGGLEAGDYPIFSGFAAGDITGLPYAIPEWWGGKDDSGATVNTVPINAALANGGVVELKAPAGGYYAIDDTLTAAVAGTTLLSPDRAEIRQTTGNKGGIAITASSVAIRGLTLTGPQYAVRQANEIAINASGADASNYIGSFVVEDCAITSWGEDAICLTFVDGFRLVKNDISNIWYAGVIGTAAQNGRVSKNYIDTVVGTPNAYGITLTRHADDSLVTYPRSRNVIVESNVINNVLYWEALDSHAGERIIFANNTGTGNYMAINVGSCNGSAGTPKFAPLDIVVKGNSFDSGVSNGTASYGLAFQGARTGGVAQEYATGVIVGNIFRGYGYDASATGNSAYIYVTRGVLVEGNAWYESANIALYAESDCVDLVIRGNLFHGTWSETRNVVALSVNSARGNPIIDGNHFARGSKVATYTLDSNSATAINLTAGGGTAPVIGRNTLNGVGIALHDTSNVAGKFGLGDASTSGTGEDDLHTATIYARTLGTSGGIRVIAAGTKTGGNDTKILKFYFGGSSVTFHAANNTNDWRFEAIVINAGVASQCVSWVGWDGATPLQGYEPWTVDTTADVTVKLTGECANAGDTITNKFLFIERL